MNIILGVIGFVVGFVGTTAGVLWLVKKATEYAVGRGLNW